MLKFPTPLLITQSNASERIVIIEKNLSCINAPLEDLKKVFWCNKCYFKAFRMKLKHEIFGRKVEMYSYW